MTPTEKFEHSFWLAVASDAEGTLRRVRSLRQELCDSITADKVLNRFYPGADNTSTKANEAIVSLIDRLLAEHDEIERFPF
jgi:hypothetical protein